MLPSGVSLVRSGMRITVDIPDDTYRLLKSRAAAGGTTVKAIVLRGVEIVLAEQEPKRRKKRTLPIIKSKAPGASTLPMSRSTI